MSDDRRAGVATAATPQAAYPLSSLQAGILFSYVLLGRHSGADVLQVVADLREPIDERRLAAAWRGAAAAHDALRTSFRWEHAGAPLQDVWPEVDVPFVAQDWRDGDADLRAARMTEFLRIDRERGFALDRAPLFRVALFRVGDEAYQLVWTFHHAVLDGHSLLLVLRGVFAEYDGSAVAAAPGPRFADHIAALERHPFERSERFWRERLRGFVAPTPSPPASLRAGARDGNRPSGRAERRLSEDETREIERFAREHDLTLTTILHGAWSLLLGLHAAENDVVFGAIRACRHSTIEPSANVAGLFINILPVRVHLDPEQSVLAWLHDVRAGWNDLRAHENTPFSRVQGWSEVVSPTPLFETVVTFEKELAGTTLRSTEPNWSRRSLNVHRQPPYALMLNAYGSPNLSFQLSYDRERYDADAGERILDELIAALHGIVRDPAGRIADIDVLTPAARSRVVDEFNRTSQPYPRDAAVHDLFAAWARATPDAIAVTLGDLRLTYAELDRRADALATLLRSRGIRRGDLVGLCVERSFEMVVALLGILKSGAAYVPLDPEYPPQRLSVMLADSKPPVILTKTALVPLVEQIGCECERPAHVIALDGLALLEPAGLQDGDPVEPARATDPCYVMYTSGSTGKPKGVVVPHRGVVRLVRGTRYVRLSACDVVLGYTPLSFDLSTFDIWGALLNGACIALVPAGIPSFTALADTIASAGVTVMLLATAIFERMVEAGLERLRGVRDFLICGDVLSPAHARRAQQAMPECRLINAYGPTENTTFSTAYALPDPLPPGPVPIGPAIENSTAYVLDANRRPVPIGVWGELYTGGDGVALGYLGRPALSAERFVRDPFVADADARMYRTGDLARWRDDGNLEFLGRMDGQLKIRGVRIEPVEIEEAILAHPAVRETVVVGKPDPRGGKRLIAYVVARDGAQPSPAELTAHVARMLPGPMVPAVFVAVERFALTPSGKIDRLRLPEVDESSSERAVVPVAPRTVAEHVVAEIWAETLRNGDVGIDDNFFARGGDSLLAMRLTSRVRDTFGIELPIRDFFTGPTVAQHVAALAAREPRPGQVERIAQIVRHVKAAPLDGKAG